MAKRNGDQQFEISPELRQDIHDRFVAGLGDPSSPASQLIKLIAARLLEEILAERAAAQVSPAKPKPDDLPSRKVPLAEWAALNYDPAPSAWTLRQWVRSGQIVPAPEKVGKGYYVLPSAQRITDSTPTGAMAEFLNSPNPVSGSMRRRR